MDELTIEELEKTKEKDILTFEEFESERMYREGLMVINFLLEKGVINDLEFEHLDEVLKEEYNPFIGGLL